MSGSKWRSRAAGAGLITSALGLEVIFSPLSPPGHHGVGWLALTGGIALASLPGVLWVRDRKSTTARIQKHTRTAKRHGGVQSAWQHFRITSSWAMRRQAAAIRPSLAELSFLARMRVPLNAYSSVLGRNGMRTLRLANENVTLRLGGARSGKSTALACRIIDHDGPAVVTSTRVDLLKWTAPLRAQRGPLYNFNPGGVGDIASTLKWCPLPGCTSIETAMRRAADMIPEGGSAERESWQLQARMNFAPMLFAAARAGETMATVLRWVTASGPALRSTEEEIAAILEDVPESVTVRHTLSAFFAMNDRTRTSIVTAIMPALRWLTNPKAAAIGDSHEGEQLDVDALLDSNATVYMLGSPDGVTGPLTAALTAEIAFQAAARAEREGGRLDPALLLALDEVTLTAPGPVDRWTSDMGGRAILLDIATQSLAWLDRAYGETGRKIIWGNANVVLVGKGISEAADLELFERLSGGREVEREQFGPDGKLTGTTSVWVPTLSAAQISDLDKHTAVVLKLGPPCIIRMPIAFKRRDIKLALKNSPYRTVKETRYAEQMDTPAEEGTA